MCVKRPDYRVSSYVRHTGLTKAATMHVPWLFRKCARREPRRVRLRLVATVDERGHLRGVIHGPIDLPALVVVLVILRVEASFMTVFEDVASERKDHRRVVWRLHDVFVRPCRRISPGEGPRCGVDEGSDVVRKRLHRSRSIWYPRNRSRSSIQEPLAAGALCPLRSGRGASTRR